MGENNHRNATNVGVFLDERTKDDIKETVRNGVAKYDFDQYKNYPSKRTSGWIAFADQRLDSLLAGQENYFFLEGGTLVLCRISSWDKDHFGFGMAMLTIIIGDDSDGKNLSSILKKCIGQLRDAGLRFVSVRIAGDDAAAIHIFEDFGFRYYETIIWPVLMLETSSVQKDPSVRLMAETDVARVIEIAGKDQFKRSHYHLDKNFDSQKVDEMHAKWAKTSWENHEPSAVIDIDGKIAGYFAFKFDEALSVALGIKYARMRSLTLDSSFRGKGYGRRLFGGAIALMQQMGAEAIDSGYASKNHQSARLHVQYGFESVFEEVTLHLWL